MFVLGYPLRFTGHFVFVLTANLSHFLSKTSVFWRWVIGWEDWDALGACVWSAALQGARLDYFSFSFCVECMIERAVKLM